MKFTKFLTVTSATLAFIASIGNFNVIGAGFDSPYKIGEIETNGVMNLIITNTEYAEMSKAITIDIPSPLYAEKLMKQGRV